MNLLIPQDWKILALDSKTEREISKNLSESIIFLAFSEFEGLPVPPVEAALSGNIVIGYHGQGGREYWSRPSFIYTVMQVRQRCAELRQYIALPSLALWAWHGHELVLNA